MRLLSRIRQRVGEQTATLLRSIGSSFDRFWRRGAFIEQRVVDYDLARELYANSNTEYQLGAGFCRPIIDSAVEFMGLPRVSSDDADLDDWLNDSIREWWQDGIQQILRNTMRDSKAIVRVSPYDWRDDPLISADDSDRVRIEVIEPERVRIYYNPQNANIVEKAIITHHVPLIDPEEIQAPPDPRNWNDPQETIHEISEVITRESVRYYDHTEGEWLESWGHDNEWGVVAVWEVYNEWDSTLSRGQSDFESVFPFIIAFHELMYDSLQAHKYHSIPKVKFKLADIDTFLRNNFPASFDSEGEFTGTVAWQGKEILFMQEDEDASFVEAKSILGDSKTLMEFVFDCICIASETPAWALMRTEQGAGGQRTQDALTFTKKIDRKRRNFSPYLQTIFKIALVMSGRRPVHVKMSWDTVRPEDEAAKAQAFQQETMALEVAAQRRIISDQTYRARLRRHLPEMKNPAQEERDAEDNAPLGDPSMNGNAPVPVSVGGEGGENE